MPFSQSSIFDAIRRERDYQDNLWGPSECGGKHSVTEMLVYIRDYTEEALHTLSRKASPDADVEALHNVRKIAALAVAAMEQCGVPERLAVPLSDRQKAHGVKPE